MSGLRRLIVEVHRRSLWQVLAIYVGGAWICYEAIQSLTEGLGLPQWFPGLAVVLFVIGLPIVLATAFVQEVAPTGSGAGAGPASDTEPTDATGAARTSGKSTDDDAVERGASTREQVVADAPGQTDGIRRLLTWRNVLTAGLVVFAAWGVVSAGWVLVAVPGLVVKAEAADFFSRRDKVVVAAFENETDQPALELAVREAIITDLSASEYVDVLDRSEIKEVLERMRLADTAIVDEDVALEIARRGGHPAVISGSVTPLGSGFQLSARVIEASSGEVAVRLRETAASDADVVTSVEKLSRLLRRHLGERLTSLQHSQPLPEVTTASLPALELYARGVEYGNRGELASAVRLLEQAVALDTAFATAYRALSIFHGNQGNIAAGQRYVGLAYAHLDRLAARERNLVGALNYAYLNRLDSAAYYYTLEIERDSASFVALNNLGDIYERMGRYEDARPLYRRALELEPDRMAVWVNKASIARTLGDHAAADSALAYLRAEFPGSSGARFAAVVNPIYAGDFDLAEAEARAVTESSSSEVPRWEHWYLSFLSALRGDMVGTLAHADSVIRLAEESGFTLPAYLALEDLQLALLAAGDPELALPYNERVQAIAEGETEPFAGHIGLAIAAEGYALAGDLDSAARLMQWVDSIAQSTGGFHPTGFEEHVRAIMAFQEGRIDEGIAHLERARANGFGLLRRKSRLLLADAEAAQGRLGVAAAHYDSLTASYGLNWTEVGVYPPLLPLAHERAAGVYLQLGDTARAVKHLAAFVELWREADPELQPRVRAAEGLLSRLTTDR